MSVCVLQSNRDIGFILLAAGRAKRFGGDKLQANYRGRPLWSWAAEAAEKAGFTQKYIVVADHSSDYSRSDWSKVVNLAADEGMGTSIAAGVGAAQHCSRLVVGLADMPLTEPEHLAALAAGSGTIFTRYSDGKLGSPGAFPASVFEKLQSLSGDAGASSLSLSNVSAVEPSSAASLSDVDTADHLIALSS